MKNSFKIKVTATSHLILAAMLTMTISGGAVGQSQGASQPSERCSPLFRTSTGRQVDASFSAHDYSKKNIGAVGISIFPGRTLTMDAAHTLGNKLVDALKHNGVEARCFVHYDNGPKGTGINFKIAGLSWSKDGPLNILEATNVETLRGVIAEAKTARALLSSN
ncbi:hypothetical protein ACR9YC_02135 [Parasphingorhabdus sp. DH2-15]|uniref:hypothetical protein n=1 Tax=Parasphingorhabdus sp. DH2-15 TaxID=3444112 RepID=UPI003F682646